MPVTRLPETFPLATIPLADAVARQFRLLECVAARFEGPQLFEADAGVVPGLGRPRTTARVEAVLAEFLGAEDAALVQGAGTGAIRAALGAAVSAGEPLLIHRAPVYRSTAVTLRGLGVECVEADFNRPRDLKEALAGGRFRFAYVQHARQRLGDSYDPGRCSPLARPPGCGRSWTTTTPCCGSRRAGWSWAPTPPASPCSSCTGPRGSGWSPGRAIWSGGSAATTTPAAGRSRGSRHWTRCGRSPTSRSCGRSSPR
ncbi:hypothetical protein GCM10020254_27510 [Streptomyces goshikiensis]